MDKVQVVNTNTGEVSEYEWTNTTEMRSVYQQIKAQIDALERAKRKVADKMDEFLGKEDRFDFGDGFELVRIHSAIKEYPVGVVRQYLDEDQLDLVLRVDGKKLKDLLADLVKQNAAPPGAWKDIEAHAEVKPKRPYVKVQKA